MHKLFDQILLHESFNHTFMHVCMHGLAETEAEKEIGVELTLDDDVVIGEDFIMKATITNKGAATK